MGNVKDKLILGRIKHRMQGNNRLHYQYELDTSTFFPCLPPFEGLQISFYDHWGVASRLPVSSSLYFPSLTILA